jgi:hypothetical protein
VTLISGFGVSLVRHAAQPKLLIRLGRWRNSFDYYCDDFEHFRHTDKVPAMASTGKTVSFTSLPSARLRHFLFQG